MKILLEHRRLLSAIYILYSIYLYLVFIGQDSADDALKSFLIPCLAFFLYNLKNRRAKLFLLGSILFSALGDCFLIFNGKLFFLFGLGSFLMAHVFYCLIMVNYFQNYSFFGKNKGYVVFLLVYLLVFMTFLSPYLGDLFFPVLLYATVLAMMVFLALSLNVQFHGKHILIVLGAIFFLISDSLLGVSIFYQNFYKSHFFIMLTYLLAQSLLVYGLVLFEKMQANRKT